MDTNNTPTPNVPLEVPADEAVKQATPAPVEPQKHGHRLAIILMAWPACSMVLVIALYALVNYLSATLTPAPVAGQLPNSAPPVVATLNIVLFLIGGLTVVIGPISFITGFILLIVRMNKK